MMIESRQQLSRAQVTSHRAMVTAMHPLAARAGARVLEEGGNAVDAAATMAFAVSVVEPFMSGLGGRGSMLIHRPGAETVGVDYTLRAPGAVSESMWPLEEPPRYVGTRYWRAVVDGANHTGHLAIGVPGVVAGLATALDRFGTITLQRALEPAIELAEDGFEVDWFTSLMIVQGASKIQQFAATTDVFFDHGVPRAPGSRLVQEDLARTLKDIAEGGPDAFYKGRFARLLAEDMLKHGGLITREDMARYEPTIHQPPLIGSYRGYRVVGTAEASGSATVVEALNILEGYDLASLGPTSSATLHLLIEALRQAFADKVAYIGDPGFVEVPLEGLVSKDYAAELRRHIDGEAARDVVPAGNPWAFDRKTQPALRPGRFVDEGENTTGITAIDNNGMAVALSQTHSPLFGSGVTIPGTGVLMNAAMQGFNPEPGSPNSVAPGKRPVWSNSPMMVLRDGDAFLCVASPGSRRVVSAEVQVIVGAIDFQRNAEQAVSGPRLHAEPATVEIDDRSDPDVVSELQARGHKLTTHTLTPASNRFGRPSVIIRDADGVLHGCSEPHGPGTVEAL